MTKSANSSVRRLSVALLAGALLLLGASRAAAEVRRVGDWPVDDPAVTLSLRGVPRAEAIRRLADEAGWSVVVQAPTSDPVDLHVKGQRAVEVLELLLTDGAYVARRTGTLVAIAPDAAPAAAGPTAAPTIDQGAPAADTAAPGAPPAGTSAEETASEPTAPPAASVSDEPPERGEDRVITGGSGRVAKDEVVGDFSVMGGSAEVLGTVTGDASVLGGSLTVRKGARIYGDASALGGSLTIEDGARIDGDVDVLGGRLIRSDGARIGGEVVSTGDGIGMGGEREHEHEGWSLSRLAHDAGSALTRMALLFVFGAVLFGLATGRMERMQTEVAARPMRTFAYGVVGLLVATVTTVALCITVIGIPVAIVGAIVAVFATYAGICAVLAALGAALVQHKSQNPYVHLAVGCAVYLVAGSLPYLGGLVTVALVLIGIGVLVTTRGAGFIKPRKGAEGAGPYRRAATPA